MTDLNYDNLSDRLQRRDQLNKELAEWTSKKDKVDERTPNEEVFVLPS